ncbi:MAG: Gfo/Idh/MocA family oxidoreductase [Pirellulaceae bacterium]|nr:Gfo/Idh/MocA family oxidoreductase [Pirellulaceae bacterium]
MTITRRTFCEQTILAAAAAAAARVESLASSATEHIGHNAVRHAPHDMIGHAIIGCRIRGKAHAEAFGQLPGVVITHVCDPDRQLAEELSTAIDAATGRRPEVVVDLRRVFDSQDVHTVSICTPNHWHALATVWALDAEKHVYVEKPLSHTVDEGQRMVAAVARSGRICQVGTQNRSHSGIRAAREFVQNGGLGRVTVARTIVYGRRHSIGEPGRYSIPPHVDSNLWLGPAADEPLSRPQLHYDWHWVWNTGNGELGNNNIHYVDLVRWVAGLQGPGDDVFSVGGRLGYRDAGETPNTQMVVHRFGSLPVIQEVRGLPTAPFSAQVRDGWIVSGTEGMVSGTSWFDPAGHLVKTFPGALENHFENFMSSVRQNSPNQLTAPVTEGHPSTALCHFGNISHRTGQTAPVEEIKQRLQDWKMPVEVVATFERMVQHLAENQVDLQATPLVLGPLLSLTPEERFVDHAEANRLLSRTYRAPFAF